LPTVASGMGAASATVEVSAMAAMAGTVKVRDLLG
jgi:hypothetical protein